MKDFKPRVGQIAHFVQMKIVEVHYIQGDDYPYEVTFEGSDESYSYTDEGKYYIGEHTNMHDIDRLEDPPTRTLQDVLDNNELKAGMRFKHRNTGGTYTVGKTYPLVGEPEFVVINEDMGIFPLSSVIGLRYCEEVIDA